MPEVAEHLIPQDGVSKVGVVFASMEATGKGGARFTFEFNDRKGENIGSLSVRLGSGYQNLDAMMAAAHQVAIDALRQSVFRLERHRAHYEKIAARSS